MENNSKQNIKRFTNDKKGRVNFYSKDVNRTKSLLDSLIGLFGRNKSEVINNLIEEAADNQENNQ